MKLIFTLCLAVVGVIFLPLALLGAISFLIAAFGAIFGWGLWAGMPLGEQLGGVIFCLLAVLWCLSAPIGLFGLFRAMTQEVSLLGPGKSRERRWVCIYIAFGMVGAFSVLWFSLAHQNPNIIFWERNSLAYLLLIPIVTGMFYLVRLNPWKRPVIP